MHFAEVEVQPPWPGVAYKLACPAGTSEDVCRSLGPSGILNGCFEPEVETAEVLNAFLLGCGSSGERCVYVDIGCNVGAFAGQAAALGATVDCVEPSPFFVSAIERSRSLNGFAERLRVRHAAVAAGDAETGVQHFRETYLPCGVGAHDMLKYRQRGGWTAQRLPIATLLRGRRTTLLKIDIDSIDGALLHRVVELLEQNATIVETILIELGSRNASIAWCAHPDNKPHKRCRASLDARPPSDDTSNVEHSGGHLSDLWRLQALGYHLFRVNIHTGGEILDWRGENVNTRRMVQPHSAYVPVFNLRGMRKLEYLPPSAVNASDTTFARNVLFSGQSVLLTRHNLFHLTAHHVGDLMWAGLSADKTEGPNGGAARALQRLNRGNPAYDALGAVDRVP